jgi:hypothetical protein
LRSRSRKKPNHLHFSRKFLLSRKFLRKFLLTRKFFAITFFFVKFFVFAQVFANKCVFSKLIKTFRGNTKRKIFVSILPSNGAAWHDAAPQCWLPQCWLPQCRTGAAWHAELEPHDMMRLRNADYRNSDYRNANYHNANYYLVWYRWSSIVMSTFRFLWTKNRMISSFLPMQNWNLK